MGDVPYDNEGGPSVASKLSVKILNVSAGRKIHTIGQLSQKVVVLFSEATPSWMFI